MFGGLLYALTIVTTNDWSAPCPKCKIYLVQGRRGLTCGAASCRPSSYLCRIASGYGVMKALVTPKQEDTHKLRHYQAFVIIEAFSPSRPLPNYSPLSKVVEEQSFGTMFLNRIFVWKVWVCACVRFLWDNRDWNLHFHVCVCVQI